MPHPPQACATVRPSEHPLGGCRLTALRCAAGGRGERHAGARRRRVGRPSGGERRGQRQALGFHWPRPHRHRRGARPCRICAGTWAALTPVTSAPGPGLTPGGHICIGTPLTPAHVCAGTEAHPWWPHPATLYPSSQRCKPSRARTCRYGSAQNRRSAPFSFVGPRGAARELSQPLHGVFVCLQVSTAAGDGKAGEAIAKISNSRATTRFEG